MPIQFPPRLPNENRRHDEWVENYTASERSVWNRNRAGKFWTIRQCPVKSNYKVSYAVIVGEGKGVFVEILRA